MYWQLISQEKWGQVWWNSYLSLEEPTQVAASGQSEISEVSKAVKCVTERTIKEVYYNWPPIFWILVRTGKYCGVHTVCVLQNPIYHFLRGLHWKRKKNPGGKKRWYVKLAKLTFSGSNGLFFWVNGSLTRLKCRARAASMSLTIVKGTRWAMGASWKAMLC